MVTATTIESTTWSTERNPTMYDVTWNTWGTCVRTWCQCMSLHALKILRFRSLSFLLSVSVVVLWLSSLIDARTLSGSSRLKFESSFIPSSSSCFMRTVSDLFDLSIYLTSYLFISSSCSSCCLTPSTSLMSWITSPPTTAEELGP